MIRLRNFLSAISCLLLITTQAQAEKGGTYVFMHSCQILDGEGKLLRKFPGGICTYADDGSVYSSSQHVLQKFSQAGTVVWSKKLNSHHTIRMLDQKRFLLLTSSFHHYKDEIARFDRISIYNTEGFEIQFFDFYDHRDEIDKRVGVSREYFGDTWIGLRELQDYLSQDEKTSFKPVLHEYSHANSIYEIPENKISKKIAAFTKGNFIVSVNGLGLIFILSRDFKSILWSLPFPKLTTGGSIHDVQISKSGIDILYYANNHWPEASAILSLNPLTKKQKMIYRSSKKPVFFGESQGGVQELERGQYLISQLSEKFGNRIFIINNEQKITWEITPTQEGLTGLPIIGMQDAKRVDLTQFLKNNKATF